VQQCLLHGRRRRQKAQGSAKTNPEASSQQPLRMTDSPQLDQPPPPPPTDQKSVALAAANALPNLVPPPENFWFLLSFSWLPGKKN